MALLSLSAILKNFVFSIGLCMEKIKIKVQNKYFFASFTVDGYEAIAKPHLGLNWIISREN
jgi:hypothetical protein